jgi:hypothetical protein
LPQGRYPEANMGMERIGLQRNVEKGASYYTLTVYSHLRGDLGDLESEEYHTGMPNKSGQPKV